MQRQEILTNGLHNVNKSDVVDVERDDVEEDFINGKHRVIEDPEYDYEEKDEWIKKFKNFFPNLAFLLRH